MASRVDNLYFFIVAVTAFFAVLVSVLVIFFAAKYHTKDPLAVGAAHSRVDSARAGLVDHSFPHLHRDLRLGRRRVLRPSAPA